MTCGGLLGSVINVGLCCIDSLLDGNYIINGQVYVCVDAALYDSYITNRQCCPGGVYCCGEEGEFLGVNFYEAAVAS